MKPQVNHFNMTEIDETVYMGEEVASLVFQLKINKDNAWLGIVFQASKQYNVIAFSVTMFYGPDFYQAVYPKDFENRAHLVAFIDEIAAKTSDPMSLLEFLIAEVPAVSTVIDFMLSEVETWNDS